MVSGKFYFVLLSKVEENASFIKNKKFTVCQKQTKQVIKISQHGFLEKGVKKQCWLSPPVQIQPETNLISEPLYFGKYSVLHETSECKVTAMNDGHLGYADTLDTTITTATCQLKV